MLCSRMRGRFSAARVRQGTEIQAAKGTLAPEGRMWVRMNYATHGWTTPGGRVEAGESPLHALQREVREESGLDVIADGLVGVYCKPY